MFIQEMGATLVPGDILDKESMVSARSPELAWRDTMEAERRTKALL